LSIEKLVFFLFLVHALGSTLSWIHHKTTHQAIVIGNHKISEKLTLKDGDLIELKLFNYESNVYNFCNLKNQTGVISREKVWLLF
jgi:hypothetical protein